MYAGLRVLSFTEFRAMVRGDRNAATQAMSDKLDALSPSEIREYEEQFLENSMLLINPDERTRAMEIYAALKLLEYVRYGEFRGFTTMGGPIGG
jgi:hypothetical protein